MFTGIIETLGRVESVTSQGTGKTFWISSPFSSGLNVDQSIAHDGVCLTIEEVGMDRHRVTAIQETLSKTNLGLRKAGDIINLERCMQMNGRLDGHIVQGHIDATAICLSVDDRQGSWEYRFSFPAQFALLIIEKGSVCLNGISLTAFNVANTAFSVAVIPYTYDHTNIKSVSEGTMVNIEFDVIGKYVQRVLNTNNQS